MRSSKSRSRSKSNRQRSPMGNIVNRVFDSSGPEGKVRGTPQQIIDKYLALARDAQLGNDRVAAENFLQHAEHYARMLGEAQREQEALRAAQGGGEHRGEGGEDEFRTDRREAFRDEARDGQRNGQRDGMRDGQREGGRPRDERPRDDRGGRDDRQREGRRAETVVEVIDFGEPSDSGLVDTPEARAGSAAELAPASQDGQREGRPRRGRRPRSERADGGGAETGNGDAAPEAPEAAE